MLRRERAVQCAAFRSNPGDPVVEYLPCPAEKLRKRPGGCPTEPFTYHPCVLDLHAEYPDLPREGDSELTAEREYVGKPGIVG